MVLNNFERVCGFHYWMSNSNCFKTYVKIKNFEKSVEGQFDELYSCTKELKLGTS